MNADTGSARAREVLTMSRLIVGGAAAGALALGAVSGFFPASDALHVLVFPAGLVGLVSPVLSYRLYQSVRERIPAGAGLEERCAAFLRANLIAVAIAEGAAFFGLVVYLLTHELPALIGLVTLVLLVGAIWPSEERLEPFLEGGARM